MSDTITPALPPLAHSVDKAALRVSPDLPPRAIWTMIKNGELKSFKIGRHRLIADSELQALVERRTSEVARAHAEVTPKRPRRTAQKEAA